MINRKLAVYRKKDMKKACRVPVTAYFTDPLMYQNKAIIILRTFTPQEMRQMDDFVLSPFFNKNQKVADLYLVIRDSHPDFDALS